MDELSVIAMIEKIGEDKVREILKTLCNAVEDSPGKVARDEAHNAEVEITFPIIKGLYDEDGEQRLVTGIVLEPNVVDAQGDYERPEVIKDAAHKFLSKYNQMTQMGLQHNMFGQLGVDLVESWIAPQDMDMGNSKVTKGSWIMTALVSNDTIWSKIKNGEITGFSIGGAALIAP